MKNFVTMRLRKSIPDEAFAQFFDKFDFLDMVKIVLLDLVNSDFFDLIKISNN